MKNEILNSLDVIQETCNETEVAVAEAIIQECYKAMDILGYSDTDAEQFNIIQEGKIMDDVKKQGEGQSKVMRILSFIPRLIAALFKAITGKLQNASKSAKNITEHTKGKDESKMKAFIEGLKKGDKKAVKTALIGLGAAAGVAGVAVGTGVMIKKKKSVPKTLIGAIKEGLSKENGKAFDEFYKSLHEIMTDEEIEEFIDFIEKIDYDKLSKKYPKEVLDEIREYRDELKEILADSKNSEKELNATESSEKKSDNDKKNEPTKNTPETPIEFPTKMNKAIDDIMKQYSDLQNSGDVKLIDFIYNPHAGLEVAYNCSIWSICSSIADMGHHIINYPSKVEQYKSFLNSYSENVKKNRGKFRMMVSAIAACVDNNIRPKEIKKDKLWSVIRTDGLYTDINDKAIKRFDDHHFKDAENDDLKNNTDAIKAINTISDCIRDVNTDVIAYITDIVDIITRLEDIFGYEKMWSHTDEESWKAAREVHKS